MRKFFAFSCILAAAAVLSAWPAGDCLAEKSFEVGARGYYWDTSLDATMQTEPDPEIDLKDDLNIDDEAFFNGEVFFRWGRHHFTVAYTTVSHSGSSTDGFIFNGIPFTGTVDSDLEYDLIDGIYQYDLVKFNPVIATFNLGLLLQVKYIDGFVQVAGDVPGFGITVEKESYSAPVPMVGVGAGVGIIDNAVVLEARASGLEYSGDRAIDGQGMLVFAPPFIPFLKVFGGYRILDVKVDEGGFKIDYTLDGFFGGLQLSF
ncbi:MAG: hypothetical protein GTN70_03465 [Deltaproteobacteria bacterium]|nr:hypothetical protein [Deltaproteobacteria bacterium]NIS76704.1 hypothetical protein [Deltaproteobacteria bacterium]